ncbi:MAG: fibronectin type III domain-containing protein [Desulforhopalus sp.]
MKSGCLVRLAGMFFLGTSLLVTGCGYKNPPIPPENVVPKAIENLLYTVEDDGVKLTWSYPVETIKGSAIDDISSFELFQAEIPLDEYCGSCPIPFGEPLELDGGSPIDGEVRRKATFTATQLRSGYKYFYKVRSRTSWWAASADSNIITFLWFQPAAAPAGVEAVAGDRQVTLSWQPVTTLVDGDSLDMPVRYQVLRSFGGKEMIKTGAPTSGTNYVDQQVVNGRKYFYAVQSLMVHDDELVEGKISEKVAVSPVDMTPPVAPSGVTAVRTDVGIKIFWDSSDEPDVTGYRVYRRAADKDKYELLGTVKAQYTLFVDSKAGDSVRYYYAVTAIDQSSPPNESKKSREATVRY